MNEECKVLLHLHALFSVVYLHFSLIAFITILTTIIQHLYYLHFVYFLCKQNKFPLNPRFFLLVKFSNYKFCSIISGIGCCCCCWGRCGLWDHCCCCWFYCSANDCISRSNNSFWSANCSIAILNCLNNSSFIYCCRCYFCGYCCDWWCGCCYWGDWYCWCGVGLSISVI